MTKISKKIAELAKKGKKKKYNYRIVTEYGEIIEKFRTKETAVHMIPYFKKQYMWIKLSVEKIDNE